MRTAACGCVGHGAVHWLLVRRSKLNQATSTRVEGAGWERGLPGQGLCGSEKEERGWGGRGKRKRPAAVALHHVAAEEGGCGLGP
eukprot:953185-Rhodomonas_salina.3